MPTHRTEHDSLGKVKVPSQALYGAQTSRALATFQISGRTAHPDLIRAYLYIKSATASANLACQTLGREQCKLITEAVNEILKIPEIQWPEFFPIDPYQAGAGTSQNMNINEVIANFANRIAGKPYGSYSPIHPNDHVNCSQSTNDTFPTATRLALLKTSAALRSALSDLSETFRRKGKDWQLIPKAARTHLQDAVPMTLGQEFAAYGHTLKRCAKWIESARDALRELGIGGSAAGTSLNVPKGFIPHVLKELEKLTGEKLEGAFDLREAMQSQSPLTYYSSMLRLVAIEMTRICNDLRLLSSGPLTGLSEILLPAVQPGSSIMPGKINPSVLEMANQTWFSVMGYDQTTVLAAQAGQLELNVMMPIMAYSLLEATRIATTSTEALKQHCIEGILPNETRLRRYFESTPQVATVLSPILGYEVTAKLVQDSLARGISIIEAVREKNLIPKEKLEELFSNFF